MKNWGILIEIRIPCYLGGPAIFLIPRRLTGKYVMKMTHNRHVIENIDLYPSASVLKIQSRQSDVTPKKRFTYCC
jgi:hypothetical protein